MASFSRIAQNNETLLKALPPRSYRQAVASKIDDIGTDFFTPRTIASDAPPDIRLGRAMQMRAVDPAHIYMMTERSSLLDDIDPLDLTMRGIEPKRIMGIADQFARFDSPPSRISPVIEPLETRQRELKQAEKRLERLLNDGDNAKELSRAKAERLSAERALNEWKIDGKPVRDLKHLKETAGKPKSKSRRNPERTLFPHMPRLVAGPAGINSGDIDLLIPIMDKRGKPRGGYRIRPLDSSVMNPPKMPKFDYGRNSTSIEVPSDEIKDLIAQLISTERGHLFHDLEIGQDDSLEPNVSAIGTSGAAYDNDHLKTIFASLASNKRDSQPIRITTADRIPLTAEMVHPGTEEEDVLSTRFLAPRVEGDY